MTLGKLAIAATFTAEPLEPVLRFWMGQLGLFSDLAFAPYNQVFQAMLDPASVLGINRGGINALLIRPTDWVEASHREKQSLSAQAWHDRLKAPLEEFIGAVKSVSPIAVPTILMLCPANDPHPEVAAVFDAVHRRIEAELTGVAGLHLITPRAIAKRYPVAEVFDARADELGAIPYTPAYFAAIATMLARTALAIRRAPYKVIVADCDNTLWRGVCGEGGVSAVAVDEPFRILQRLLIEQSESGRLVCLCSKNVEQDVFDIFDNHPDMLLPRDRLVGWRINWKPKSQNLRELASELNLGIDSFIFLDDNPVECAEVRSAAPEVLTLQLPQNPAEIPDFLAHLWPLDQLTVSDQDRRRTEQYLQNAQRESVRKSSAGLSDFLARLELEVDIHPVLDAELPRAAQLTQRTNQFNATTIRRSEAELMALLRDGAHRCLMVRVKDRFGDYGLVGEVIVRPDPSSSALVVDTLLLSCRVLGRGVEHQLIAHAGKLAVELNLARVDIPFELTAKNRPMLDFLESIASKHRISTAAGSVYAMPAENAAELRASVAAAPIAEDASPPAKATDSSADRERLHAMFERIALALRSPETIVHAAREWERTLRGGLTNAEKATTPRTDDERKMLEIWRRVLNVDELGIDSDYFKSGGTSILAVRLVLEVERAFGRRLPIATLLDAPTVEKFTRALRTRTDDSELAAVTLRAGIDPPLFLLPGTAGHAMAFAQLAKLMNTQQRVIGMEMRPELEHNRRPRTLQQIAAEFIGRMTAMQPSGPFLLAGWSFGGALAFEAAHQLHAAGREVALVVLFDTYGPGYPRVLPAGQRTLAHLQNIWRLPARQKADYLGSRLMAASRLANYAFKRLAGKRQAELLGYDDPKTGEMVALNDAAWAAYQPRPLPVRLTLLRASHRDERVGVTYEDPYNGWKPYENAGIDVIALEANHLELFEPPAVATVASALSEALASVLARGHP
jgi:FkbH-like protein